MDLKAFFKGTYGTMYYVRNMASAVDYYKKSFGFKARMESPDWVEFEMPGGQAICLHKAEPNMKSLPGGTMILNVVKLKELCAHLKETGVKFEGEPHNVHADDYTVNFIDLDGNQVNLYGTL